MIAEDYLKNSRLGLFRNLKANKRLITPSNTSLRFLVISVDVHYSMTVTSFGIIADSSLNRLN